MSLAIDLPPAIVQQAKSYASLQGTTLSCLLREYVADLAKKNVQDSSPIMRWRRLVAKSHGRLKRPYKFNRDDAYAR